jgi:hypothetical protein
VGPGVPTAPQIRALAFGPDGTLYASGAHVPVQRYDLHPDPLITEVCRRAGSGLSGTAWKTYLRTPVPAHLLSPGDGVTRS